MTEPLLSTEQAAERMNVTPAAVSLWIRQGKIRATRLGSVWRIDPADLKAFITDGYKVQQERQQYADVLDGLTAGISKKGARQRRSKAA